MTLLAGYIGACIGFVLGFLLHAWLTHRAREREEAFNQMRHLATDVRHKQDPMRGWTGCRDCYGSGGRRNHPCARCGGSGKLDVHTGAPYTKPADER